MSTPGGVENNQAITDRLLTCRQRLYKSLDFGFSSHDDKERKRQCPDIEMQKHVVHSISEFLGFISADTCQHPLVKDSVADVIKALEGILQCNSEAVLIIAAKVALKLVRDLPSSMLQSHVLHLIQPFASLLSSHQVKVASRCANGLNHILPYLTLCGNGVERLLENGENFIKMVVHCMDSTQPPSVRIEAFKLAQLLTMSEQRCSKMLRFCCEPIVQAIIGALREFSLLVKDITQDQVSVAVEAGRLALITRWAGEHHIYFWKLGIGKVLIGLRLSEFFNAKQPQDIILTAKELCIALKDPTFTWDILGGLVTHCGEDFNPKMSGNDIRFLIDSACGIDMLFKFAAISKVYKKRFDGSSVGQYTEWKKKFKKEVHLSSHVHHLPLVKLLEFVYLGYLQAGEDLVKTLKSFVEDCKLQPLLQMLHRNRPKWGMPFPGLDLALALNFDAHIFLDVALQAEATKAMQWTCNFCSVLVPHVHVHKVILCSSSGYFRAMFQSGMQECHSRFIKVPVSWEALVKLVDWLYSDKLPTLVTGCLWDNMDEREKPRELQLYLELCLLADYLLLDDDIQEHCSSSPCGSCPGTAVNCLAPSYSHLCLTGEIEKLDEELVDMVHAASVQHSQGSTKCKLEE
ncbi:hypothetical protein PVL29_026258 [Vitis rotundifolia]|uniref:BTB domain-containing protein n=1 Tax=Vitis rotundifolia TaxID=103349 RepID=A0AA39D7H1_VITRO|nr:hypothetical protein PVL29_026258 [Vitis rotundifolia]